jgi:hypothetical protein
VEIRQTSGPRLERIAAVFRQEDRAVVREIRAGFQAATGPLDEAVKASELDLMPSGYGPTLAGSTTVKARLRTSGRTVTSDVAVYATGVKGHRRDVVALNRGLLKHPVYGRVRRTRRRGWVLNPWVEQAVPPGFGDQAVEAARPDVDRAMDAVLDRIEAKLLGA